MFSSTAIGPRKYRIPSDLRSQAGYRLVSTTVGDHVGILGAVVFAIFLRPSQVFEQGELQGTGLRKSPSHEFEQGEMQLFPSQTSPSQV